MYRALNTSCAAASVGNRRRMTYKFVRDEPLSPLGGYRWLDSATRLDRRPTLPDNTRLRVLSSNGKGRLWESWAVRLLVADEPGSPGKLSAVRC